MEMLLRLRKYKNRNSDNEIIFFIRCNTTSKQRKSRSSLDPFFWPMKLYFLDPPMRKAYWTQHRKSWVRAVQGSTFLFVDKTVNSLISFLLQEVQTNTRILDDLHTLEGLPTDSYLSSLTVVKCNLPTYLPLPPQFKTYLLQRYNIFPNLRPSLSYAPPRVVSQTATATSQITHEKIELQLRKDTTNNLEKVTYIFLIHVD